MIKDFKNIFEVRKAVRFELQTNILNRNVKINHKYDDENILLSFYEMYKNFIELLLENFWKKEEKKYNYEWYNTIQFSYRWLEDLFISEFIENKEQIKYNINGKKKPKNYITFWELWDKNFIKNFFENFFTESEKNLEELEKYVNEWLENKSRKSDMLFLIQKINTRDHLWKLYTMFEKNYIQHKNDSSIIEKLKTFILKLRDAKEKLLIELKTAQSFWIPVEHISLNYYSVNKTPKELTTEIKNKIDGNNIDKKYKWTFKENNLDVNTKNIVTTFKLNWEIKNALENMEDDLQDKINIKELKEITKLFKARQKAWLIQLLQSWKPFNEVWDKENKTFFPFYFEFMWEKFDNFQITLFPEVSLIKEGETMNNYERMLSLTSKIERETDKEERTRIKMKRWMFFQYTLKTFKNFSEGYKKIAQKYWRDSTEIKSLKRQKIDATKLRWWWFLSKENENYFINTFDVEESKNAFKEINKINGNWNDIQIFILSSITLRGLDKLCFRKDSTFVKGIDTKDFDEIFTADNWKQFSRLKSKNTLLEEWKLLEFYVYILENQKNLNLKFRAENSLDILKQSKDIEEFEINLKLETYELIEKNTSKEVYENILKIYKWNSYKITSYDLEKWLETKKYTKWWFDFWEKDNKSDKYLIRLNPELTIFFKEKDKDFIKENPNIKKNRRLEDSFILSTNFSFHSNKSYIDSAFINEEKRKDSIETFNQIFNSKNRLDYFYWLDKWTNELITLWVFKNGGEQIEAVNISEKIPVYKITNKWLNYFEYIKNESWEFILDEKWEKKKRYLSKNVSYFIKDLENKELFEKLEINSCLWDLTYAKLIKWNIILNADIFTTLSLYRVTAKRFLNDAITRWEFLWEKVLFDERKKSFYYEYLNRWIKNTENIFYMKDEFAFLSFDEKKYNSIKEEIESDLNEYIKNIKLFLKDSKKYNNLSNENISIQKINNYKNAISANIVWIIIELQKYFGWYICYETLDEWQILKKWLNTFIGNVVNEKIYNRLQLNLEVPPILKKFRTDIWIKWYIQHWKVIYIYEKNTSSACPICNWDLLKIDNKWKLVDKTDSEIYKLWWHMSNFENEMKHLNDDEYNEWLKNDSFKKANTEKWKIKKNKYHSWKLKDWKNCDFYIGNQAYPEFNFIKSWDDLATYNIAKKAKEYLEKLKNNS